MFISYKVRYPIGIGVVALFLNYERGRSQSPWTIVDDEQFQDAVLC
jgi:hypothetical protein